MSGTTSPDYGALDRAVAAAQIELEASQQNFNAALQRQQTAELTLQALIAQRDATHNAAVQGIITETRNPGGV